MTFVLPEHLSADVREVWFRADDLTMYTEHPETWRAAGVPLLHAAYVDVIVVHPLHWRKGICRRFIESLRDDDRFEMAAVGMVTSSHLWDALERWGWVCNRSVQDFYWAKSDAARAAVKKYEP